MDPYAILDIPPDATAQDIKKAYRKAALRCHPDKNPAPDAAEEFKKITAAYEMLRDEAARAAYDSAQNGTFADTFDDTDFSPQDFFNFFNDMKRPGARAVKRTPDAHLDVKVLLRDLFKGKVVKINSSRKVLCRGCRGSGYSPKSVPQTCKSCKGQGAVRRVRRVGPGMVTTDYVDCKHCHALGKVYREKDRCKKCDGGLVEEKKILEFNIPKGSKLGDNVVLEGELDQAFNMETGDVILRFVQEEDEVFERKGNDLHAEVQVSLVEALCGFLRVVMKHLDGTGIRVTVPLGKVLRPGDYLKVTGQGMPILNSDLRGDLYLRVNVIFPEDGWCVDLQDVKRLQNVLPGIRMANVDVPKNDVNDVQYTVVREEGVKVPQDTEEEAGYTNGGGFRGQENDFVEGGCATQ